jgi:preprotein translocase subunit SecA
MSIYGLGVVEIPTNRPIARIDEDDQVYRTGRRNTTPSSRRSAAPMKRGQPVLVGTTSIDKSEC